MIANLINQLVDGLVTTLGPWGYLIVFLATILENIFVVGSFTPGEIITAAGGFAASRDPRLSVWIMWACAIAGTMVGSNLSYLLGVRGGRDLLERMNGRFGITHERLIASEAYFRDHGDKTIFFARFLAVFKNFAPVLAGASRMSIWKFQLWTLLGAVTYSSAMIAVGWFLGANFEAGLGVISTIGWIGTIVVIVVVAVAWFARKRVNAEREARELEEARQLEEAGEPVMPDLRPAKKRGTDADDPDGRP
jgi:membrane protein DedA with SNARE-associated domain